MVELEFVGRSADYERTRAALLALRRDDECFGDECFMGTLDGHSPQCVDANAVLGFEKLSGSWHKLVAERQAEIKAWRESQS